MPLKAMLPIFLVVALIVGAVRLTAPEKGSVVGEFTGVWELSFEHSAFYEGATYEGSHENSMKSFFDARSGWMEGPMDARYQPCVSDSSDWTEEAYHLTFYGERKEGPSGHLGLYPAKYTVFRIIEIKRLPEVCDRPPNHGPSRDARLATPPPPACQQAADQHMPHG